MILHVDSHCCLLKPTVVCLGFFDGVHIGHIKLIERAREVAQERALSVCVHTFSQMPVRVLSPDLDVLELTPLRQKADLLDALGVEIVAVSDFDQAMAHMHAEDFFFHILLEKLHTEHIVAGFHHRFGYRGEADTRVLASYCEQYGIGLDIIEPVTLTDGALVSSTAIRQLLLSGDYATAEAMLGRPYACVKNSGDEFALRRKSG